jgi:Flp pilus assembly protein TadD
MAMLAVAVASLLPANAQDVSQALRLYQRTQYERSLEVLADIPDKTGPVHALTGRNYYMKGDYKRATEAFEKALAADPKNSEYALWLGRAYGRRAETSSPFTAPGYASKARQNFEKAAAFNPRNIEALNDLLEYYLQAPGFLGGGYDKAVETAARIKALDAAEGYWAQSKLAEKRKQFSTAEEQLRRAAEAAPQQVGRLLDLARFLAKRGRHDEADENLQRAEKMAPNSPQVIFTKADLYVSSGRNLETARELLKRYLNSTISPDDPPKSEARKLLRQAEGG